MIRKAAIVVLTLAAVGAGVCWIASHICFDEEVYEVGPLTCSVGCYSFSGAFLSNDDRYFRSIFESGYWIFYTSEELTPMTFCLGSFYESPLIRPLR